MSLYGALAAVEPGKKLVSGTVSVTTAAAVALGHLLESIDHFAVSYQTQPVATNAVVHGTISGTTLTITCRASAFTPGTTAAVIHYLAVGDAPK